MNLMTILFSIEQDKAQEAVDRIKSTAVLVLISLVIFLFFVGLGILLFLSIRKTYKNEKSDQDILTNQDKDIVNKAQIINAMNGFANRFQFNNEMTLFLFEFDNAKSIRDAFGEKQYEKVLKNILAKIKISCPRNTIIAMTGVDQYAILLRGKIPMGKLQDFVETILSKVQSPVQLLSNISGAITMTASAGIAIYPAGGTNSHDLIKNAEMALYRARKDSTTNYVFYSNNNVDKSDEENLQYYQQIKDAMRNREFTLVYQPIVDTENNEIYGFEALIRWVHPTLGVLPPNSFLNIMEHTGDIVWVGKWGLEALCVQYRAWGKDGLFKNIDNLTLSINLSPKQLLDPQIAIDFQTITKRYHINPKNICLEIVEFAMFEKYGIIAENIQKLHNVGFKIAIDDFGLDVNSLSRISDLPIDIIKFEKDFVDKAEGNYMMTKVTNMLVDFAKDKNKKIVAEGIENLEELDKVKAFNIYLVQGYLFLKPSTPLAIETFVKNEEWKVNIDEKIEEDETQEKVEDTKENEIS